MNFESERSARIAPIPAIEIKRKCTELRSRGERIIDLSIGDTDFNAPHSFLDGVKRAFDDGLTHYTLSQGITELRERIGKRYGARPEEVLISGGGKEGIFSFFLSMVNEGDEVIIPDPSWPPYRAYSSLCGARTRTVVTEISEDFEPSPEAIKESIGPRTKLLVINSPNNPTGAVYGKELIRTAAELADDHDFLLLSDEIYSNYDYSGEFISARDYGENVMVIDGFSKTYSMTGIRLCYLVGGSEVMKVVNKIHGFNMGNAPSLSQHGIMDVLAEDDYRRDCRDEMKRRRDMVWDVLNDVPGLTVNRPRGAFYMFPGYEGGSPSTFLCEDILGRKKVALVPGIGFGAEGHFRIAFSQPYDLLREGVEAIADYFEGADHERK